MRGDQKMEELDSLYADNDEKRDKLAAIELTYDLDAYDRNISALNEYDQWADNSV